MLALAVSRGDSGSADADASVDDDVAAEIDIVPIRRRRRPRAPGREPRRARRARGVPHARGARGEPERLDLNRMGLRECCLLEGEHRLRLLNYQGNRIARVSRLGSVRNLVFLDLTENALESLEGVEACPHLRVLLVGKNKLRTLGRALASLPKLDVLDARENGIDAVGDAAVVFGAAAASVRVLNLAGTRCGRRGTCAVCGTRTSWTCGGTASRVCRNRVCPNRCGGASCRRTRSRRATRRAAGQPAAPRGARAGRHALARERREPWLVLSRRTRRRRQRRRWFLSRELSRCYSVDRAPPPDAGRRGRHRRRAARRAFVSRSRTRSDANKRKLRDENRRDGFGDESSTTRARVLPRRRRLRAPLPLPRTRSTAEPRRAEPRAFPREGVRPAPATPRRTRARRRRTDKKETASVF